MCVLGEMRDWSILGKEWFYILITYKDENKILRRIRY